MDGWMGTNRAVLCCAATNMILAEREREREAINKNIMLCSHSIGVLTFFSINIKETHTIEQQTRAYRTTQNMPLVACCSPLCCGGCVFCLVLSCLLCLYYVVVSLLHNILC